MILFHKRVIKLYLKSLVNIVLGTKRDNIDTEYPNGRFETRAVAKIAIGRRIDISCKEGGARGGHGRGFAA